ATSHALQPIQTVVSVKNPIASLATAARLRVMVTISCSLHVADERFAFVDRYVGIADPGREVVDNVAGAQPHPAPMPRHPDVVNRLASDLHHADSVGDERLGPDVATGTRHHDPVEILDSRSEERRVGKECRCRGATEELREAQSWS